jgi:hypothetical protein
MCPNLKYIFIGLTLLWFTYLFGVVYMAIHVHNSDLTGDTEQRTEDGDTTTDTLLQGYAQKASAESIILSPHAIAKPSNQKATLVKVDELREEAKLNQLKEELAKKSIQTQVQQRVGKDGGRKAQGKPEIKQRMRPHFVPEPYGHMVKPQELLPQELVQGEGGGDKQQQSPGDATKSRTQVLKTYSEPIDQEEWERKPLPIRTSTADDLTEISYPKLNSCKRLTEQWPVDNFPDDDPFLPWIHDVFPTDDGKFIQFVAQNKRRCHTGTTDEDEAILKHMAPQVALFQHVAIKRINNTTSSTTPRYRLSSHEEADPDGIATRFICRFKPSGEETLSVYNHDYEWATVMKRGRAMFNPDGRNNNSPHTAQLMFQCPVPTHLVDSIRTGASVQDDWATIFIDLIPIRTPPRYGSPSEFLVPSYAADAAVRTKAYEMFQPDTEWGKHHILPRVEDSGRWENIPVCRPSLMEYEPQVLTSDENGVVDGGGHGVNHHLVSCLWASTGYTTRGNRFAVNDGQRRLLEWITYNKLLGFDHFYIYDNSGAFNSDTSLQPIADMFPGQVTIIPWPSQVCSNNPNNVDSPGERSSQYAAETSCRLRFGPHVKWIGQFDIDEYLVPMGNYQSILPLLEELDKEDNKIISFASWRSWPRRTHIE